MGPRLLSKILILVVVVVVVAIRFIVLLVVFVFYSIWRLDRWRRDHGRRRRAEEPFGSSTLGRLAGRAKVAWMSLVSRIARSGDC